MRDLRVMPTPGMIAIGDAGTVPASNKDYGGLKIAHAARTATIAKCRAPCFGHVTTKLKGDIPYRGAALGSYTR